MTRRDWAKLFVFVCGFYIVFTVSSSLRFGIQFFATSFNQSHLLFGAQAAWYIVSLCVGIVLILFCGTVARWIFPERPVPENQPRQALDQFPIQELIFVGIGVIILATTIPQLLTRCLYLLWRGTLLPTSRFLIDSLSDLIKLAIGLYLVFGSHGFSVFFHKFKSFGLEPKSLPGTDQK